MNRLERLASRRTDSMVKNAMLLSEVYRDIQQSDAVRYAVGAMQPIDQEYTKNTFAQGDRVRDQLKGRLTQPCVYRYQGSTTNDTHIRAKSDIDLLVIRDGWVWLEHPQVPQLPYAGDPKQDMRNVRDSSCDALEDAFPQVEVDKSGAKSISLEGGSLTRKVDVVPVTWWNTNKYAETGSETWRGVTLFDIEKGEFIYNLPFLHNQRIEERDVQTFGGMRKAARLMKSLKYDAEKMDMSSYDITSIAYNIPNEWLAFKPPFELRLVDSCREYCRSLRSNETLRNQIVVPNNTRTVFDSTEGTNLMQLQQMIDELERLSADILKENSRSFVKLAEARVEHPLRVRPISF